VSSQAWYVSCLLSIDYVLQQIYSIGWCIKLAFYERQQPPTQQKAQGLLSVSSTLGTAGCRLQPKSLDTTNYLQRQMVGESITPCKRWTHHSWMKRRGHHTKKNKTREQSMLNTLPPLCNHGRTGFHYMSARSTSSPRPRTPLGTHPPHPGAFDTDR
jgi:hypothetical protein